MCGTICQSCSGNCPSASSYAYSTPGASGCHTLPLRNCPKILVIGGLISTTGRYNALEVAPARMFRRFSVATSLGPSIGRPEHVWHDELERPTWPLVSLLNVTRPDRRHFAPSFEVATAVADFIARLADNPEWSGHTAGSK